MTRQRAENKAPRAGARWRAMSISGIEDGSGLPSVPSRLLDATSLKLPRMFDVHLEYYPHRLERVAQAQRRSSTPMLLNMTTCPCDNHISCLTDLSNIPKTRS